MDEEQVILTWHVESQDESACACVRACVRACVCMCICDRKLNDICAVAVSQIDSYVETTLLKLHC